MENSSNYNPPNNSWNFVQSFAKIRYKQNIDTTFFCNEALITADELATFLSKTKNSALDPDLMYLQFI